MRRSKAVFGVLLLVLLLSLAGCGESLNVPDATSAPTDESPAGPSTAAEHFQQGNEYAKRGEYEKAIAEYEAVLEIEPENVSALTNLGVVYYSTEQLDQAITQYKKALVIAPDDADVHSNLAAAYVQQGEMDKALAEYLQAVELAPELAQAHFGLGVVYLQLNQIEQAIEAFETFQELDRGEDAMATDQAQQYLEFLKSQ